MHVCLNKIDKLRNLLYQDSKNCRPLRVHYSRKTSLNLSIFKSFLGISSRYIRFYRLVSLYRLLFRIVCILLPIFRSLSNICGGVFCKNSWRMKFSIKDFFSKYDQIHNFMRIWSHLLKKSLMENFIFCAVFTTFSR